MEHKKAIVTILLASMMIINIAFLPRANASNYKIIIWSGETLLTVDPTYTWWELIGNPPKKVTFTEYYTPADEWPSVMATRDNQIWVAWQSEVPPENPLKFEIFYKVFNGNWGNMTQLTNNTNVDVKTPAVIQTPDNKIWIFWMANETGNYDIFYKTTLDGGATWSSETNVTNNIKRDSSPALTVTSDGKLWLVWSRQVNSTSYQENIFYKTYNGTAWSNETQLTTFNAIDELPSITQTKDGRVWVFWSRNMTNIYNIFYKTYNGTAWSSDYQLTNDTKYINFDPTAFVEKDGTMWLFWSLKSTQTSANYNLYYKTYNGTWWPTQQFTNDNSNENEPTATVAPDGSMWVIWTSDRVDPNGNPNIDLYLRRSLLGDVNKDGVIDINDLSTIAKALATDSSLQHGTGWNQYNPNCDLNADNKINIFDLAIAALNFGQHV